MKFKIILGVGFIFIGTIFGSIGCSSKTNSDSSKTATPTTSPTPSIEATTTVSASPTVSTSPAVSPTPSASSSVSPTPSAPLTLQGKWKEQNCNMGFEVSGSQFIEYDNVPKQTVTFAGIIVNQPDLTRSNGLIIIKITQSGTSGATVGHYTVARWKNFTGNQVGQTYAKDDNGLITYVTLAEAQTLSESATELSHFCCEISNRR